MTTRSSQQGLSHATEGARPPSFKPLSRQTATRSRTT